MLRRPSYATLFPYTTLFRSMGLKYSNVSEVIAGIHAKVEELRAQLEPQDVHIVPILDILRFKLRDRKSTRLNSSHLGISYAVFCLKKKKTIITNANY